MARSRRRRQYPVLERPIIWLGLFVFAYWGIKQGVWSAVAFALLAGCVYELAFVPTQCAARTTKGGACEQNTRGRLRGCWIVAHKRKKRDAIWRYLSGLRNPLAHHRKTWGGLQVDTGVTVSATHSVGHVRELPPSESYASFTITLTVVSTVAAVISAMHDLFFSS